MLPKKEYGLAFQQQKTTGLVIKFLLMPLGVVIIQEGTTQIACVSKAAGGKMTLAIRQAQLSSLTSF